MALPEWMTDDWINSVGLTPSSKPTIPELPPIETEKPSFAFGKPLIKPKEATSEWMTDDWLRSLEFGPKAETPPPPPPQRGVLGDIASSLARGVAVGIPQFAGQAITGMGALTGIEPMKETGRAITGFAEELPEKIPFLQPSEVEGQGGFRRFLTGMGESLPTILAAAKGGAAIGALTAPVTGFLGPTAGAILGGMVGVFGTFGLAGKGRAYEEALSQGLPEDQAQSYSNKIGAIEGGVWSLLAPVEAATGGLAGKFIKKPAIDTIRKLLTPTLTKSLAGMAINVPAVTAAGMTSSALQAKAAEEAGLPTPTPEEAAYNSIAPSIGISILFGLGTRAMRWQDRSATFASLKNETVDPQFREKAASRVFANLGKVDPEVAQMWKREADLHIQAKQPIPIDEDYMAWLLKSQRERVPAIRPFQAPMIRPEAGLPVPPGPLPGGTIYGGRTEEPQLLVNKADRWYGVGPDGKPYSLTGEEHGYGSLRQLLLPDLEKPILQLPFFPPPAGTTLEEGFQMKEPVQPKVYARIAQDSYREVVGMETDGRPILGDKSYKRSQIVPKGATVETGKGRISPEAGITSAGVLPTERPSIPAPGAKIPTEIETRKIADAIGKVSGIGGLESRTALAKQLEKYPNVRKSLSEEISNIYPEKVKLYRIIKKGQEGQPIQSFTESKEVASGWPNVEEVEIPRNQIIASWRQKGLIGETLRGRGEQEVLVTKESQVTPGAEKAIPPTVTLPPGEKPVLPAQVPLPQDQMDAIRTEGKYLGGLGIALIQRIANKMGNKINARKGTEVLDYLHANGEIEPQVGGGRAIFPYTFTEKVPEKPPVPLPEGITKYGKTHGYTKTDTGWEVYGPEGKIETTTSRDRAREIIDRIKSGEKAPAVIPPAPTPVPAPVAGQPVAAGGRTEEVITPKGIKAQTRFKIVEANDVITSIDTNFRDNPNYNQELQPRDRAKLTSVNQVMRIYSKLDPEQLGESRGADTGAPIVGADNMAESGNGRAVAIKKLYEDAHANGEKYKAWLTQNAERFGLTKENVTNLKNPILVRENTTPMTPEERIDFSRDANTPTTLVMSAGEKAKIDMDRLSPDVLSVFAPDESGNLLAASNREFVRSFLGKVPANEMGDFITEKGEGGGEAKLSAQGLARIKNAIFAKAYGKENSDLITMMTEDPENNIKNITNALLIAAPRQTVLMDAIRRGDRHDLSIAKEISDAARTISDLRNAGTNVEEYLLQGNLFGKNPIETELVKMFNDMSRTPRKIIDTLDAYAKMVDDVGNPKQKGLFGAQKPPSKIDILEAARRTIEEKYVTPEQKGLFPPEVQRIGGERIDETLQEKPPGGISEPEKAPVERVSVEPTPKPAEELKPDFQPPELPKRKHEGIGQEEFKKLPGIERDRAWAKYTDEVDAYQENFKRWAEKIPENEPVIFQTDNHIYLITKDPEGGWRSTSISRKDRMPTGHERYDTKFEALSEHKHQERIAKIPFEVEPLPPRIEPTAELTLRKVVGQFVDKISDEHNAISDRLTAEKKWDELKENNKKVSAILKMDRMRTFTDEALNGPDGIKKLPKWLQKEFETYRKELETPTEPKAMFEEPVPITGMKIEGGAWPPSEEIQSAYEKLGHDEFIRQAGKMAYREKGFVLAREMAEGNIPPELMQRGPKGMAPKDVNEAIFDIKVKWRDAPDVEIVPTERDLPPGKKLYPGTKGIFGDDGKVYLVAENLKNPGEAREAIFHESVGHYGLPKMMGDSYFDLLQRVVRDFPEDIAAVGKKYKFDMDTNIGKWKAAEEKIAQVAQKGDHPGILRTLIATVKDWIRKVFPDLKVTDNDIRNLVRKASEQMKRGEISSPVDPINAKIENLRRQVDNQIGGNPKLKAGEMGRHWQNEPYFMFGNNPMTEGSWWDSIKNFKSKYDLGIKGNDLKVSERLYMLPWHIGQKFGNFRKLIDVQLNRDESREQMNHEMVQKAFAESKTEGHEFLALPKDQSKDLFRVMVWSDDQNVFFGKIGKQGEINRDVASLQAKAKEILGKELNEDQVTAYYAWKRTMDSAWAKVKKQHEVMTFAPYEDQPWYEDLKKGYTEFSKLKQRGLTFKNYILEEMSPTLFRPGGKYTDTQLKELGRAADRLEKPISRLKELRDDMGRWSYYVPRVREKGDYVIRGFDKDDKVVVSVRAIDQIRGARARDRFMKEYPGLRWESKFEPQPIEEMYQKVSDIHLEQFIKKGIDRAKRKETISPEDADHITDALFEAVADDLKARGFASHFIMREEGATIKGYETENGQKVFYDYMTGLSGFLTKQRAAFDFFKSLEGIDPSKQPELFKEGSSYVTDMLRNSDRLDKLSGKVRGAAFTWYLSGSIKAAMVNFSQNFVTGVPFLGRVTKNPLKKYVQSMKDIAAYKFNPGHLSKEEQGFLHEMHEKGIDTAQYLREIRGRMKSQFGGILDQIGQVLATPFSGMEVFNRESASLAMFRVMRYEKNASYKEAFDAARDYVYNTHYLYGKSNLPAWARGGSPGSRLARTAYTFRSFNHNFLLSMMQSLKGPDGKIALDVMGRTMAYLAAFGGAAAIPFFDDLLDGMERMTGTPYKSNMRKVLKGIGGEYLSRFGMEGLPAILGADLTGSLKIGIPTVSFSDVYGVYGGMYDKGKKAIDSFQRADIYRGIESLMPAFLEAPMKGYRMATEGATTPTGKVMFDEEGKPVTLTPGETAAQIFGFRPERISVLGKEKRSFANVEQHYSDQRDDLYSKLRIAKGNERTDVLKQIRDYNLEVQKYKGVVTSITPEMIRNALKQKPEKKFIRFENR